MAIAPHIRWDRVGRVALLCVLAGLLILYLGPISSYLSARSQAHANRAEVQRLKAEHARLEARVHALRRPEVIELEARRLGFVRQGERAYVVENLPPG